MFLGDNAHSHKSLRWSMFIRKAEVTPEGPPNSLFCVLETWKQIKDIYYKFTEIEVIAVVNEVPKQVL